MSLRMGLAALALGGAALAACGHDQTQSALNPGFGLFFNDNGPTVSLAYGRANSDDVGLMLECRKGSGAIDVSDVVRKDPAPNLALRSSGKRLVLPAKVERGEAGAPVILKAHTNAAAGALQAFRKSGQISVAYGQTRYGLAATASERSGVERFFNACQTA